MFKRLIASLVCITFIFSNLQFVHGQDFNINQLPVPGTMVGKSTPFVPLTLKGLVVNPQKPLEFQFIVDTGSNVSSSNVIASAYPAKGGEAKQSQYEQLKTLVKYFLGGLTIPEGDLWVNLSPYEKDRMVPEALGRTDLGRDLLAQDYVLKQLTASLIYPEKGLGKEFWSRVYAKAQEQFGTTNVPVNTFNKVWILPNQAQVFENGNAAYITESTLKVMLDEDYTALQKHSFASPLTPRHDTQSIGANIVRQIIIPEIEKEVNTGKNFAPLRQIYQALILAKWYKETIQNGLLDAIYTNKKKIAGINLDDPAIKERIYNRYLQAYKKGAFNYIKEDLTPDGKFMPRKYFSGGVIGKMELDRTKNPAMLTKIMSTVAGGLLLINIGLGPVMNRASAQNNTLHQTSFARAPGGATTKLTKNNFQELLNDLLSNDGVKQNIAEEELVREGQFAAPKLGEALEDTHNYSEIESMLGTPNWRILDVLIKIGGPEAIKAIRQNEDKLSYWQQAVTFNMMGASWYDRLPAGWRVTLWSAAALSLSGLLVAWKAIADDREKWRKAHEARERETKIRLEELKHTDPEVYGKLELGLSRISRMFAFEELFPEALKIKKEGFDFKIHFEAGQERWIPTSEGDGANTMPIKFDGWDPDVLYVERGGPLPGQGMTNEHSDSAMQASVQQNMKRKVPLSTKDVGGIDLNQIKVNLTGKTINVQFDPFQLNELMQKRFEGFTPLITNITRLSSPFQLLGIKTSSQPQ